MSWNMSPTGRSSSANRAEQLRLIYLVVAAQKGRNSMPRVGFAFRASLQSHIGYALDVRCRRNLEELRNIRRLIRTNKAFPEFRREPNPIPGITEEGMGDYTREYGLLIARWKSVDIWAKRSYREYNEKYPKRHRNRGRRRRLERLTDGECSPGIFVESAAVLQARWRGETTPGGSVLGQYTFGDLCR